MRKVHVAIWGVHQMIMFGHLGGGGVKNFKKLATWFKDDPLVFLISKHLDTMVNVTDCDYGKTKFCFKSLRYILM